MSIYLSFTGGTHNIKKLLFIVVFQTLFAPFILAQGEPCMGYVLRILNGKLVKVSKAEIS